MADSTSERFYQSARQMTMAALTAIANRYTARGNDNHGRNLMHVS
jgi:hypothetical protein